ncbi:transposase [Streptococcus sp. NLN64]|uniref:IS110 family transposase n=1 Tax=Streptococcus sp. NLN64 TaxID=2822799 RepID=UPI0018C9F73B|nr:transposase [Streptococcus sp. NLN64]MBG9368195.1 transposase [Streptococcus sp. NLN64]
MEAMVETCCGIDVHQKSIVCCILDGPLDTNKPKKFQKSFGTTTRSLQGALDWMLNHGVTHVFLESTGQYWIPVFNPNYSYPEYLCVTIKKIIRNKQ